VRMEPAKFFVARTRRCSGTLAIALRTRSSSAILPTRAATWPMFALIAAINCRRCSSKYSLDHLVNNCHHFCC